MYLYISTYYLLFSITIAPSEEDCVSDFTVRFMCLVEIVLRVNIIKFKKYNTNQIIKTLLLKENYLADFHKYSGHYLL